MTRPGPNDAGAPVLVLVTGSGRSGTSSLAGSLKRLGFHVPQPEVEAGPTNPRGFYEPRWVIDFHKGLLRDLAIHNIDARPRARQLVHELESSGEVAARLREWLRDQLDRPRIVVKDPHAFWFASSWAQVADDLGAQLCFLTSLRHPAEVVGSRDLAYLQKQPMELRRVKETANVAGWIHAALLTEQAGRGRPRAFLRYLDLIAAWRPTLRRAVEQLGVGVDADLSSPEPHPIDDFLDSSMRRSALTWDDLTVPAALQEMGEEVWGLLGRLVDDPADAVAVERMDALHQQYDVMFEEAVALTFDHTRAEVALALRAADERHRQKVRQLRRRLRAQAAAASGERAGAVGRIVRRLRSR